MVRPLVLLTLAAAVVAAACGPHSRTRTEAIATLRAVATVSAPKAPAPSALLATTVGDSTARRRAKTDTALGAELSVRAEEGVRFALAVANPTRHRVELRFPDGRTKEFAVFDATGREVWRWSAGRLFTQSMQARLLSGGDSVVFDARWPDAPAGRYTVVAQLRSDNHPIVRRLAFEIPPAGEAPRSAQVAAH